MHEADPDSTTRRSCSTSTANRSASPARSTASTSAPSTARTVFNVIDYKSGRSASLKSRSARTGQQLQLPIYVEAAQVSLFNDKATPLAAGYWRMGSGFDAKGALAVATKGEPGRRWKDTQAHVHDSSASSSTTSATATSPSPAATTNAPATATSTSTCRIAQVRSLNKTLVARTVDDSRTDRPACQSQSADCS